MTTRVEWSLSSRQETAFRKRLERYQGLPLEQRYRKGTLAAAQMLARPIRADSPVGKTGNLKRSVRASNYRRRAAASQHYNILAAYVTPRAPHAHLVIRAHREVSHTGKFLGGFSTPNPFVDRAIAGHLGEIVHIVSTELFGGA